MSTSSISIELWFISNHLFIWASLVAQTVKNPCALQETQVQSLGQEDPMEKGMATYSSILAWRILWTEEPGRLQTMGLQRVAHGWVTKTSIYPFIVYLPYSYHLSNILLGVSFISTELWGKEFYNPTRFLKRLRAWALVWLMEFADGDTSGPSPGTGWQGCWGTGKVHRVVEKNHLFLHRISLPSLFPFSFAFFLILLESFCSLSSMFFFCLFLILFSLSAPLTLRLCRGTCQTHSPSFWTNTCSYDLMHRPFCLHGSFPLQGILTPAFSPRVAGKSVGEAQHVREQQQKSGEPPAVCREPSPHISRDRLPDPCKETEPRLEVESGLPPSPGQPLFCLLGPQTISQGKNG